MALAVVALGGETGKGVGLLGLLLGEIYALVCRKQRADKSRRTLRNSLVASCHSLVMVEGGGLAKARMVAKMTKERKTPATV